MSEDNRPIQTPSDWTTPAAKEARFVLALVAIVATFIGWKTFLFLTDDAYIEFRYVANSMLGRGFVWNPAPFRPVEGYTSFLWVCILRVVWTVTRVAPPNSANYLSLSFGYLSLFILWRLVSRMALPVPHSRMRLSLMMLVLLGTISNRTFLTWLSSGLETSLFNMLFIGWIYEAVSPVKHRDSAWLVRLSAAAALVALARPDGILAVGATVVIAAAAYTPSAHRGRHILKLSPLLAIPVHFIWRRVTYGAWLPNTYYAKHVRPWPASGVRYAASFVLEYGVWVWLALAVVWLVTLVRTHTLRDWLCWTRVRTLVGPCAALGVVFIHLGYYTLSIGGDHFEYRVYSYLVPLLFYTAAWMAVRVTRHTAGVLAIMLGFIVASWPIPWTHWAETHDLNTREATYKLVRPIADDFPPVIRPVVRWWDQLQAWMIPRHVCMRHQEHKIFHDRAVADLPTRSEGERISWDQHPVAVAYSVGVVGWVLPNVAVIDFFGLNDRVISHGPVRSSVNEGRLMAHDRIPPGGYVECFRPNVQVVNRSAVVTPRSVPLTDRDIVACESRAWY